ncbi:F0F1 ATP synthase subunit A [Candidatus Epulonipiscium viviparus]|uniref:F0F1 ATP synthase subunit A n=1 Tax=Candidatus Epulonipiscium viviparus TaxID=420336 RepID=UPI00016C0D9D|nr:F0F1 ATP synthase subunit A [Candidatus Epulopiscium viviparus]
MDEQLDFGIHMLIPLFQTDNGDVFGFTTTHVNTWIIMAILTIFGFYVKKKVEAFTIVPETKFQVAIESIVSMFESFTMSTMGEKNKGFSHFYGPMFLFILFANLSGLILLRPPTADIATTFALSLTTFFMVQLYGIKSKGIGYYKELFQPIPLLFPLNVVGELANPISLSFRLFGNILGGTIIMGLYYAMIPWFGLIGIPSILHMYFDVFAGTLQTLIFVMLSMTFVSSAME